MPPSRRLLRRSRWLLWPVAFVIAGLLVAQGSWSAFSAKVSNGTNSFSVGTVNLNDDDAGSSLFALTNRSLWSHRSTCTDRGSIQTENQVSERYETCAMR